MQISMATNDLRTIFDACKSFVSKADLRPALQGVQLRFADKRCTAYALDGIKMMTLTVPYTDGDEGTVLVPIIKLPKDPFTTLSDEGNEITFDFGGSKQTVRKYAEDFMQNPDRVFPTTPPGLTIYFDPKNLRAALDGFKAKAVELQFHGQTGACVIQGDARKALVLPVYPPKKQ